MDGADWCYILTSVSKTMQHQHKSMHTPYYIMVKLKVMFEDQNHDGRQKGIKVFLNTNMAKADPRSSIRWKNPGRFDAHKVVEVL